MSRGTWSRYPPCVSDSCADPMCCSHGHKFRWPELLGKKGNVAKSTIQKDNPEVTVEIIPPQTAVFGDFCCNRVFVFVDKNGIVIKMPTVG